MIKFDNKIQPYIDFLNEKYSTTETVQLKPLYGHDSVSVNNDDTTGWAVYISHSKTIALPMEVPQEFLDYEPEWLFHNLAHEYKHFLDDVAGKRYCKKREKEADEFADKVLKEYKLWDEEKQGGKQ